MPDIHFYNFIIVLPSVGEMRNNNNMIIIGLLLDQITVAKFMERVYRVNQSCCWKNDLPGLLSVSAQCMAQTVAIDGSNFMQCIELLDTSNPT